MRRIFVLGISILLLFSLSGCTNSSEKNINDKLDSELEYIEDIIFKISNKYAKGEYLEDDKMKWEEIKDDVIKINSSWGMLILDLTDVNVQNKEIIDFSNNLNNLIISVSEENEINLIDNLSKMYEKIINFKKSYNTDKNKIYKNEIKSGVLKVFNIVNKSDWEGAKIEINSVTEQYQNLMKNESYAKENEYNINKIYVLLEEYNNSINTSKYDLVRLKYISTVENL